MPWVLFATSEFHIPVLELLEIVILNEIQFRKVLVAMNECRVTQNENSTEFPSACMTIILLLALRERMPKWISAETGCQPVYDSPPRRTTSKQSLLKGTDEVVKERIFQYTYVL